MIKQFLLFAIASLVMLPALADKPTDKPDKGNKDGAGVPLYVEFRDHYDTDEDENIVRLDRFGSDGFAQTPPIVADYIDGEEPVSAHIGKFRFGLNVGVSGIRNFFLDLTGCYVVSPSVPLMSCDVLPALHLGITTGANVFATSPDGAQYLTMGVGTTKEVNFQLEFLDDNGKDWRIMFNPSKCPKDDKDKDLATMATVTKTAVDTWEFEATTVGDVACLQLREGGAKHWTFHGLYSLPFKIEATALP